MPWLTIMGLLPLLGAAVVWALPHGTDAMARVVALATSLATLAVGIGMALRFDVANGGLYQFAEQHAWIPQFGVELRPRRRRHRAGAGAAVGGAGADLRARRVERLPRATRARNFFALILVLETFMIGVFAARDVFLFYVFFEAMLIPMYFLIGQFGGAQRRYAAVKFLLYSLFGGLVMLVAVIGLYAQGQGGEQGFLTTALTGVFPSAAGDPTAAEVLLFLGFFFAFAVKAPLWPVHTWLPDAAGEAPPASPCCWSAVLDKVGTFGMLTLCLPLFPNASRWAAPVIMVLAVISVLYGALLAIGQTDLMRLIAYTSISHFGFIVLGIFAMTSYGQSGSTLYMVNHGISTAALFLIAGMLVARRSSSKIADFGGLQEGRPGPGRSVPDRRSVQRCRCPGCPASSASSWCWSAPSPGTRRSR